MMLRRPSPRVPRRFSSAVAALLLALTGVTAFAQDFPKLKPGLWEMERETDRAAPGPKPPASAERTTMCLDESVQREMFDMAVGSMKGQCSRHDFKQSGNRLTGDFVCDIGGSRMHSKSTMVFDGNTAYRTEIDTTYDPPFLGQTKSRMVLRAHNVGACKPGQRPGDVVMPNGHTMNMRDLMNGPQGAHGTITPGAITRKTPH
jgi:uncharacterized protein DUF3617